ncbi:collagen-like protein [Adhaeribacter sp. BT258]|uniref:Collagen-like protein n=1 Tax=Adhaeribacter terrigena TaxID=2793070 RepID=A0ABS1C2W9_9BACT|nr:collagen-like protein [Adhaeribacter terrigena]MBK0403749.1 collagen-like protein [Adhaeribacter terrigena]
MKKLFYLFFLLAFTSCTIHDSDTPGPMGPPGATGPQGPAGNANVISTEHITLNTWVYNSQYRWYYATVNMPEITPDVTDYGLVMVYQRISGPNNPIWIPLPDTYGNVTTNYEFYDGGITIYRFNVDNSTPSAPASMVVRVVIIPDSFRKANPGANWKNYEVTKEILKLQD